MFSKTNDENTCCSDESCRVLQRKAIVNQCVGCRLNCKIPHLVRAYILPSSGVTQERLAPYSLCQNEELALKNKGRLVLDYFKELRSAS